MTIDDDLFHHVYLFEKCVLDHRESTVAMVKRSFRSSYEWRVGYIFLNAMLFLNRCLTRHTEFTTM